MYLDTHRRGVSLGGCGELVRRPILAECGGEEKRYAHIAKVELFEKTVRTFSVRHTHTFAVVHVRGRVAPMRPGLLTSSGAFA